MDPLDYLRANPGASRKQVMQACSCSSRAARRAEDQLALESLGQGQRRLALGAAFLVGLGVLAWALSGSQDEPLTQTSPAPQPSAARATEAAIYSALDTRDKARSAEVATHLESGDEGVRLAALRFLASVDPAPYLDRLLPCVDDPSRRVRLAALQLLGQRSVSRLRSQEVTERLLQAALASERDHAERRLALTGLRGARPETAPGLPRRLLPALADAQLAPEVSRVLTRHTGKRPAAKLGERPSPSELAAAWHQALEGTK